MTLDELTRLSGVDLTTILYRRLTAEHSERIDAGLTTLAEVCDRLAFVRPPFDLANIAAVADEFDAGLIVLDYIQRIQPPGEHSDKRGSVDATMNHLRALADAGVAVVVLSAVGRTKDKQGRSSYSGEGLSLASFRESSELEFGADDGRCRVVLSLTRRRHHQRAGRATGSIRWIGSRPEMSAEGNLSFRAKMSMMYTSG